MGSPFDTPPTPFPMEVRGLNMAAGKMWDRNNLQ